MAIQITNALQRVKNHKRQGSGQTTLEGIFLSSSQLIQLGEELKKIPNGPNGVCFMIGKVANSPEKTVEIIPYKITNGVKEFYKSQNIYGSIHIDAGKEEQNSVVKFIIDGNMNMCVPANDAPSFGTGNSQKTPPPFPPQ
jgi:hypothetical protein